MDSTNPSGAVTTGAENTSRPEARERFVDVPGGRVWTSTINPQAQGVPLLVVHGGPGASHDYLANLEALAMDRPVVFYDQLGCGRSDKPVDPGLWSVARSLAELDAIRGALGLASVHLLGQSWGGAVVASYVLDISGSGVKSLVLCAPLLASPRWLADQQVWLAELPEALREAVKRAEATGDYDSEGYRQGMEAFYNRHLCRLSPWPQSVLSSMGQLNTDIYGRMWGPSEFTATGPLKDFDLTDRLGDIAVPTLLVCGEFDEAAPTSMRFFGRRIPGSHVVVIENASHMHHLERPDAFMKAVGSFLRNVDAGSRD